MSFGDMLGQIMNRDSAASPRPAVRHRAQPRPPARAAASTASSASCRVRSAARSPAGGLRRQGQDFLRQDQVGGLSGAQIGGIGALAGALLGGGLGGAARGGAMAVLGTLAIGALKAPRRRQAGAAAPHAAPIDREEIRAVTGPDTERLLLQGDDQRGQGRRPDRPGRDAEDHRQDQRRQRDRRRRSSSSWTRWPRRSTSPDWPPQARTPAQAAEVYAASLLAIDADTDHERAYLHELAAGAQARPATVAQLHQMTGVPGLIRGARGPARSDRPDAVTSRASP